MIWWILSLSAAFAVAMNGTMVAPMVVLAVSRLPGYGEASATLVAASEIAGIALYSLLLPHQAKRHGRGVAVAGFALVIAGEAASFWLMDPLVLSIARLLTGFGEGAIFGLVASRLAARANAERLWGSVNLIGGTTTGLLLLGLTVLPEGQNGSVVFLFLAGFTLAMMPLALLASSKDTGPAPSAAPIRLNPIKMALTLAGVLFVYGVQSGQWAVAVFIGEQSNLGGAEIGIDLAISSVVGFAGALVPAFGGNGWSRLPNMLLGFLLMAASLYAFLNIPGSTAFLFGQICLNIGFYIITPYVTGLLTEGDADGALLSRVLIIALIGASIGTAVAGPILDLYGAKALCWIYMVPLALSAAGSVFVFGRIPRADTAMTDLPDSGPTRPVAFYRDSGR